MFRFTQISENTKKLSQEFRNKYKDIEWGDLIGLRNKIVHEYGNVNLRFVYDSLTEEIPQLYELLTNLDIL
ncbi:MAG: DUF86 domain-containing protein [Coprobacillus sp.]|nr:DUF86 domain-containing protein [Coprobacillus sp.]